MLKRLADDWPLVACIFAGIVVATTLASAAPVCVKALERLGLNLAIYRLVRPYSNISVFASNVLLTAERLHQTESYLVEAIDQSIAPVSSVW